MGATTVSTGRRRAGVRRPELSYPDGAREDIQAVADKVIGHLSHGRRAALDVLLRAGDEIHELRATTGCGPRAVALLAVLLRMDESGLQKWGRLAELIRGKERSTLFGLTDRIGFPLTPSLILELERVHDAGDRMRLARTALDEGLSVAQLRALIRDRNRRPSPNASLRSMRGLNRTGT
jgi:hypothetical protein